MSKTESKELALIVGAFVGLLIAFAICVAIIVGIPTAAIVWIIETIMD